MLVISSLTNSWAISMKFGVDLADTHLTYTYWKNVIYLPHAQQLHQSHISPKVLKSDKPLKTGVYNNNNPVTSRQSVTFLSKVYKRSLVIQITFIKLILQKRKSKSTELRHSLTTVKRCRQM